MPRPQNKNPKKTKRLKVNLQKPVRGKPAGTTDVGATEKLQNKIQRAWNLRAEGFFLDEIATAIASEFGGTVVTKKTIHIWLDKYRGEWFKENKEMQARFRMEQFMQLERLKRKFLPLACAEELTVKRYVKDGGETLSVIDENAFEEQRKAAEVVIKIMARQGTLIGFDLGKVVAESEGGLTIEQLQLYILNQVAPAIQNPGMKPVAGREVLELEAGHPGEEL